MKSLIVLFTLLSFVYCDQIINLPGLNESINFDQYAGYLTVDPSHGRNLFYWFVESQNDPDTDPVILWLNGGPGCSSLIGLLSENGPFRPSDDGSTLFLNPYSWNQIANMIYLESPAGVGFSYSNDENDYNTGDNQTASDNYQALLLWFKRYPQFIGRDFYISGESYAGHYIPQLAAAILEGNAINPIQINLVGILVGNGLTDNQIDLNAGIPNFAFHNVFPLTLYSQIYEACSGDFISNFTYECALLLNQSMNDMGNINPYDIYAPVCNSSGGYQPIQFQHPLFHDELAFDSCIDLHLTEYLNNEDVIDAIHAIQPDGGWTECSSVLNYDFSPSSAPSMLPYYMMFFTAYPEMQVLIYSGDVDGVLPTLGTQEWISVLPLSIKEDWRPWYFGVDVGGYVTTYDEMTFLTIRGAGHMVPYFSPERAYAFFSRFILGQPF